MSYNFKPRRGKKSTMIGAKAGVVLESGEFFIELPEDGKSKCKVKIGDGATSYPNLPYALGETYSLAAKTNITNANIILSDDIGNSHTVVIKGQGATEVFTDTEGNIIIKGTNTVYTHPNSGVSAGIYKSVTVNAQGHVTGGTNPTTLSGYGIIDAASKTHTHKSTDIESLDASKLTGIISIDNLPAGALERLVNVSNSAARFKLTSTDVQLGDTVREVDTGLMFYVIDVSKLSSESGYQQYTAGTATSVPWSGVTDKPTTFTPSSHTHDDRYYTEAEIITLLEGYSKSDHTHALSDISDAGAAAAKGVTDTTIPSAIGTSSDLVTARKVHYGLPKFNNSKTYNHNFDFYVATTGGTAGQILVSGGNYTKPEWKDVSEILDAQVFDYGDEE